MIQIRPAILCRHTDRLLLIKCQKKQHGRRMSKIRKIEAKEPDIKKRRKTAAYARVSMETERLSHSFQAQTAYYENRIKCNPQWEYAGVYTDFGVSGTTTKGRSGFRRLLADCEAGSIDLVLVKSISRFARNTADLLSAVRRLKELGTEVWFEKEGIHTFSGEGELMLSVMASFAQEESRSISENSKWGIRKTYQDGTDGVRNKRVFGYRYDGQAYAIKEDEAQIVRYLFEAAAVGTAPGVLLKELKERGIRSIKGNCISCSGLKGILRNEIYIGDRRLQKTYVSDPIRHSRALNRGELPQYYLCGCHEPIVSRETFLKVQEQLNRRAASVPCYPFTGKIRCGVCGNFYTRKKVRKNGREYAYWICRSKKESGASCKSVNFREDELERMFARMLGTDKFDRDVFEEKAGQAAVLADGSLQFMGTK